MNYQTNNDHGSYISLLCVARENTNIATEITVSGDFYGKIQDTNNLIDNLVGWIVIYIIHKTIQT